MDLIYKVRDAEDGRPQLQQMERHGRPDSLFMLRYCDVWATSLPAARAIQRDYRQECAA